MKNFLNLLFLCLTINSFSQNTQSVNLLRSATDVSKGATYNSNQNSQSNFLPDAIIWSEDFSSGIPSTWTNSGTANSISDPDAKWEYRGPLTTPNNTVGSRGGYVGTFGPINSATAANGFVVFDSDFLDNAGIAGNFGNGTAASPHLAELTTDMIDLSQYSLVDLSFTQYYRRFAGPAGSQAVPATYVDFSVDGGATFPYSVTLNSGIAVNSSTANNDIVSIQAGSYIGGEDSIKIRFRFDGNYYFWCVDDINISATEQNRLDPYPFFVDRPYDVTFSGTVNQGHLSINQVQPISFNASIRNSGINAQTGTKLSVAVFQNGNLITQAAGSQSTIQSGDSLILTTATWTPSTPGNYQWVYQIESDSINSFVISDTIDFSFGPRMSMDFNSYDNGIGASTNTTQWGDGSQMCQLMKILNNDTIYGLEVWLDTITTPGAIIDVALYDESGYLGNSGGWNASKLRASGSRTITSQDLVNGYAFIDFTNPQNGNGVILSSNVGGYYVNITMNTTQGLYPILIRNDQTFRKKPISGFMYLAALGNWYSGYSNSKTFNNLWLRGQFEIINGCTLLPIIPNNGIFCSGDSIEVVAPVGLNYQWSTGDTSSTIFINQGGTYSLIASTQYCSDTTVFNIIGSSTPSLQSTLSGPSTFCQGDSVSISVSGAVNYLWGNGSSSVNQNFMTSGSYYVTGFDSSGYCSDTAFFNVLVNPNPVASISGAFQFCNGDSTQVIATPGLSYQWSTGDTSSSTFITQGGSHSLVYNNQYCSDSIQFNVTELATPNLQTSLSGPLTFCQGDSVSITMSGAYSYSWNNGASSANQNFMTSGSYYVIGLDSSGYCSDSVFFNVIVNPNPIVTISGDSVICSGDSIILEANGAASYLWNTGEAGYLIWADTSGIYSVIGTDSNSCSSQYLKQLSTVLNVNGTQIYGSPNVVPNSSETYTTSQNTNNSYSWQINGGAIISGQGTNSISVVWGAGPIGDVKVLETNDFCSNSDSLTVSISGVGLDDNSLNSIILSPNPNSGLFTIKVDQKHIGSSYQVLDNLGRLIDKGIIKELSQDFDLSDKPKGVYRIQVSNDKAVKTLNVVIQ